MPARYDHIKAFDQGVAAAVVGGTLEDPWQDGAAAVVRGGKWGLVRSDGTELVAPWS